MTRVGLVGAGAMGSALGANWVAGGAEVRTCIAGRSARTRDLVERAGLTAVGSLDDVVACDVVVSVVPPGEAVSVARDVAAAALRRGEHPLVVDLNAVAPETVARIAGELGDLDLVDGSVSGAPPRPGRAPRVYLSGPRAEAVAALPAPWIEVVVLSGAVGAASALKMCTASMYKGTTALVAQALLTADHFGVLDEFVADTALRWPDDVPGWPASVASAATKSGRFVDEMLEISRTQRAAGMPADLFAGVAATYRRLNRTPLGRRPPESVGSDEPVARVLAGLRPDRRWPAAVVLDFSGTLFHVESAEQALLAALGPDFVGWADEMRRWGAINGSSTPDELPPDLSDVWHRRDLSAAAHRAAYAGLSRHAGLRPHQSDALYDRGTSPEAWTPFRETLPVLRRLHDEGIPVALLSNIGWDPRPVLALHGADRYLDALVLSYEHGVEKPDPAIFRIACAELGVDPGEAVMIGDNPHADGAATAVGMRFEAVPPDPADRRGDEIARAVGVVGR
ncbi:HAD-IA family hydrolase [Jatrophihabitans endophyticus]|uniref:HAD-IA family hydrolase n=1 Tax=Jatrophihabitans endophyticus TaxID=1206085 RepID=UPI0019E130D6|nr:HAD-IA family hydrolase [Jatrophihabitans endophyticus]MBE7187171.1 HAD-IA family hydrolase [Jatrophihabitans endophyticus]